jgi:hypothetical protein
MQMTTIGSRSAFEAMGDAQILAAQGQAHLAQLFAQALSSGFRSLLGRFRRDHARHRSFV